jgi:hypothetical protein
MVLTLCQQQQRNGNLTLFIMKTNNTNIHNLKIGDKITFINRVNYKVILTITRIEEKSCYTRGRESWNTINNYISEFNAIIERS